MLEYSLRGSPLLKLKHVHVLMWIRMEGYSICGVNATLKMRYDVIFKLKWFDI